MTLHVGNPVLYRGERHLVKQVNEHDVVIEDDDGFALAVPIAKVRAIGYRAVVDSDGWVRDIEDDEPDLNREGDPAFNGAFNRW